MYAVTDAKKNEDKGSLSSVETIYEYEVDIISANRDSKYSTAIEDETEYSLSEIETGKSMKIIFCLFV